MRTEPDRGRLAADRTFAADVPSSVRHVRTHRPSAVAFSALGVLGELLITAGVLLLAFLAWQLWWTDVQGSHAQATIVGDLGWGTVPHPSATEDVGALTAEQRHDAPPVVTAPEVATTFATLLVPRWGSDYERPISEGVDRETVLNPLGIGHYPGTAMPGDVGNFAMAAHRTTYGKPFNRIAELQVGDALVVREKDTWYVYTVTSTEIVKPTDVGVIAPVPDQPGVAPTARTITLTSCHPMYSARQRYVVHGELAYWAPATGPIPAELIGGA